MLSRYRVTLNRVVADFNLHVGMPPQPVIQAPIEPFVAESTNSFVIVFFAAPVTRTVARFRTGCLAGPMVIGLDDSRGGFAVDVEWAPRRADLQRR